MMRNFKAFSLVLLAAFAMSAVAASAASAEPFWFKTDGNPTSLVGSQIGAGDAFVVDAGKVTCSIATYTGKETYDETETVVKVVPHYTNCLAFGTLTATVHMNSCYYEFGADTKTAGGVFHVHTSITCTKAGDSITVTAENASNVVKCTLHIPEQTIGTGVTLTNAEKAGVKDVTAKVSINPTQQATGGITYTQTAGTGLGSCPNGVGTTHNGTYIGEATLEGRNAGGGATSVWVE